MPYFGVVWTPIRPVAEVSWNEDRIQLRPKTVLRIENQNLVHLEGDEEEKKEEKKCCMTTQRTAGKHPTPADAVQYNTE